MFLSFHYLIHFFPQVPLGFPIDNVALGGVTLTGGCPPLSLTYQDTVVGVINKKRRQFPAFRQVNPKLPETHVKTVAGSPATVAGVLGTPAPLPKDNVALRTETDARSPSYPNANMRLVYQTMIPNTNAYAPNPALDTSVNFVVSAIDSQSNGATVHVYTKAIVELGGSPFQLSSLAPLGHPCRGEQKKNETRPRVPSLLIPKTQSRKRLRFRHRYRQRSGSSHV